MRGIVLAFALLGSAALAGPADRQMVFGSDQVWIEVMGPVEVMWVGPNLDERTQVLSGVGIEVIMDSSGAEDAALVGARALVTVMAGSHSCDDFSAPLVYHVITLGPVLAADGPLTTCGPLDVQLTNGAIVLEEDPMRVRTEDGGLFRAWVPGPGFTDRLE